MALEYRRAAKESCGALHRLVQRTIRQVYPRYYPRGIVEFFGTLHTKERIAADVDSGLVRSLLLDGRLIGTGSCTGNHITRLFIEPELQGRGYGSFMMEQLEKEIAAQYDSCVLDASLAAVCFYERRGYKTVRHEALRVNDDTVLVYDVMEKHI